MAASREDAQALGQARARSSGSIRAPRMASRSSQTRLLGSRSSSLSPTALRRLSGRGSSSGETRSWRPIPGAGDGRVHPRRRASLSSSPMLPGSPCVRSKSVLARRRRGTEWWKMCSTRVRMAVSSRGPRLMRVVWPASRPCSSASSAGCRTSALRRSPRISSMRDPSSSRATRARAPSVDLPAKLMSSRKMMDGTSLPRWMSHSASAADSAMSMAGASSAPGWRACSSARAVSGATVFPRSSIARLPGTPGEGR